MNLSLKLLGLRLCMEVLTWSHSTSRTGRGPDTQAHRYQAERIEVLAALCENWRRHQEANLQVWKALINTDSGIVGTSIGMIVGVSEVSGIHQSVVLEICQEGIIAGAIMSLNRLQQ